MSDGQAGERGRRPGEIWVARAAPHLVREMLMHEGQTLPTSQCPINATLAVGAEDSRVPSTPPAEIDSKPPTNPTWPKL